MTELPGPIAQALAPWAPADSAVRREAEAIRADLYLNKHKLALREERERRVAQPWEDAMTRIFWGRK